MATKEYRISFKLLDKEYTTPSGKKVPVAGLSELWLEAQEHLREVLLMIEAIADPRIVVGFVDRSIADVCETCDWYTAPHGNKTLVASAPFDAAWLNGEVW